ncbi:MAG: hypothetical protein RKP46_12935 [Candidatus Accumulibacter sp.]|uniref:hypothetical protein n=1 Tax=Accumulibacter sp. TaxID=2053492 RepID=UPI00287A817D|nr:hypothetical protein [Accumulibacter sp.]MDS4015232.1 hypothetical protein [Accumulibacter sp.]
MADMTLGGTLNLMGTLSFKPSAGGKLLIGAAASEALVEVTPSDPPQCTSAPPVILPPPPASPLQPQPTVWIVNSFNKTVKAGNRNLVALGMVLQGQAGAPVWPGMLLPSTGNSTVTVNHIPVNVVNDKAVIFPSGGSATFTTSGQP